jgi:hypothetical protein
MCIIFAQIEIYTLEWGGYWTLFWFRAHIKLCCHIATIIPSLAVVESVTQMLPPPLFFYIFLKLVKNILMHSHIVNCVTFQCGLVPAAGYSNSVLV